MKKILIFSLAYYPRFVSGAEAAVREITDRISSSDIEFHMLTLRFDTKDARYEHIGNIHVHRIGIGPSYLSKVLFIPLSVIGGVYFCRKYKIDALWVIMTYMLFPVALIRFFGLQRPYVLTLQDGDPYEKVFGRTFIKPLLPVLDFGFRKATMIQAISSYLGEWPRRRGYKGPIEVIYNGSDTYDLEDHFTDAEVDECRRSLGKKEGEIYLVNTARLEHQKAQDDVIRALALLPKNILFLIVGGGTQENMLHELAESLGVSSRVKFTGYIDREKVTLYRKASDIFVAPSRSEGLGNAFLSAMASRIPVIATQEGGLAEFIFDEEHDPGVGQTAWVVKKNSSEEIAEAVKAILAHPEKVKEVTARARRMVEEKFNWDTIAKDMQTKVFEKVLA